MHEGWEVPCDCTIANVYYLLQIIVVCLQKVQDSLIHFSISAFFAGLMLLSLQHQRTHMKSW